LNQLFLEINFSNKSFLELNYEKREGNMSIKPIGNQINFESFQPIEKKQTNNQISENNNQTIRKSNSDSLSETLNSKTGIDSSKMKPVLLARNEGNVAEPSQYGYGSLGINGKPISVAEVVRVAKSEGRSSNVVFNGGKVFVDFHGKEPKRLSYEDGRGGKFTGVVVQKGNDYLFVPDKSISQLGVGKNTTAPWRELGIPDWRQKQLRTTANEYITRNIPNYPGETGSIRRTDVKKTDTNIPDGNGRGKLPVLNYSDIGKIYAAIAKDQRMTDPEKFEVARMVAEGYGKRNDNAFNQVGNYQNALYDRKYLLSSQFARPENADSGQHSTNGITGFPRPNSEKDHGTHTVNGANYADWRHARELQALIRDNPNASDEKILSLYRDKFTKEETYKTGVNTGDVNSSVNSAKALLAGLRQSQASGGKSGFAAFAIQWIKGSVTDTEGAKIIRDFKLTEELNKR
jgi:hypothetical protein